jgi:hypothetical protein
VKCADAQPIDGCLDSQPGVARQPGSSSPGVDGAMAWRPIGWGAAAMAATHVGPWNANLCRYRPEKFLIRAVQYE